MNFSLAVKNLFILHCYFETAKTLYVNLKIRLSQPCEPEESDLMESCVPDFQQENGNNLRCNLCNSQQQWMRGVEVEIVFTR